MRKLSRFVVFGVITCLCILAVLAMVLVFGKTDRKVEAFGTVAATDRVNVAPEVNGIIRAVYAAEGSEINAGDTLLSLDSEELKFRIEEKRQAFAEARTGLLGLEEEYRNLTTSESFEVSAVLADLSAAQKRMEMANTNYERKKELFDKSLISLEEKEAAELNYELAQSNYRVLAERRDMLESRYRRLIDERRRGVEVAEQACRLAEHELAKTVLVSPAAGVVLTPNIQELVGTMAVAGKPLIQIGNLSKMQFIGVVSENDIPDMHVGQKTNIFLTAFPHREFKIFSGEVAAIASVPKTTPTGVGFETTINIDEPWVDVSGFRHRLIPGMTGRIEIIVESDIRLLEVLINAIAK